MGMDLGLQRGLSIQEQQEQQEHAQEMQAYNHWVHTNGIGIRHSPNIACIADALAKAQGAYEKASKDAENTFFSSGKKKATYADLASVINATRKALAANGIAVIQVPRWEAGLVTITTLLAHASGEWIADDLKMPVSEKLTPQTVGTAISYGRRYAMQAFLAVAGEDDDGNAASGKDDEAEEAEREKHHAELAPRMDAQARIAQPLVNAFMDNCKKTGKTPEQIAFYLKELNAYVQAEEIQKQHYNEAIKWSLSKGNVPQGDLTHILESSKPNGPTAAMFKTLYGIAGKRGISDAQLHEKAEKEFGKKSLKGLTTREYDELVSWVEMVEA